jgi:hypothetical protein
MRWLLCLMVLWFCPVSFQNEGAADDGWQARPCPTCPGGKCPPKRPRPKR